MTPNNGLGSLVVQDQVISNMLQIGGGGKLGAIGTLVEHEGSTPGGLPVFGPQVCDDASGRNLSTVIERQFNGYAAEEIIQEHSVSNVTPSRLEEHMNMLNFHR